MKKQRLFTIAQVSEETGIHPQTLRNWEKDGILEPDKVNGNQRIYNENHLELIYRILDLKEQGLRIKGIKNMLLEDGTLSGSPSGRKKVIAQRTSNKADQSSKSDLTSASMVPEVQEDEPMEDIEDGNEKKRQGRPQMHTDKINFDELPTRKERGSNYRLQDLEHKNLTELLEIGKKEQVPYFRQMFKEELQVAIAFPSMREELKEEVKKRLQDRYGGRVYGVKNREREQEREREKVLAQKTAVQQSSQRDLVKPEKVEQTEQITLFSQNESLVSLILKLAESGMSAEEIETMLIEKITK